MYTFDLQLVYILEDDGTETLSILVWNLNIKNHGGLFVEQRNHQTNFRHVQLRSHVSSNFGLKRFDNDGV